VLFLFGESYLLGGIAESIGNIDLARGLFVCLSVAHFYTRVGLVDHNQMQFFVCFSYLGHCLFRSNILFYCLEQYVLNIGVFVTCCWVFLIS